MITYNEYLEQGSDDWIAARCGRLTASNMKLIMTPKLEIAANDKERAHADEILAQRITRYVDPSYLSDDMLRGIEEEQDAKILYNEKYAPVQDVGFITNDGFGFTIGYSPDGLVGDDGLIEVKSRRQKFQIRTIIDQKIPEDYVLQVQTGLLVSGRKWCDFISYSGGMHMTTIRIEPDLRIQDAIIAAATAFENKIKKNMDKYNAVLASQARLLTTKRKVEQEIIV